MVLPCACFTVGVVWSEIVLCSDCVYFKTNCQHSDMSLCSSLCMQFVSLVSHSRKYCVHIVTWGLKSSSKRWSQPCATAQHVLQICNVPGHFCAKRSLLWLSPCCSIECIVDMLCLGADVSMWISHSVLSCILYFVIKNYECMHCTFPHFFQLNEFWYFSNKKCVCWKFLPLILSVYNCSFCSTCLH